MRACRGYFWGSAWAEIGAPHWAFISRLNGSLREEELKRGRKQVSTRNINSGSTRVTDIGLSSLSFFSGSMNSSLLEWGVEEEVSASGNESKSVRATAIDQNSWGLFSRLIVVDALDRKMVNRHSGDSKDELQVPLLLIEAVQSSLFLTMGKRATTKALATTRSGHCNGKIKSLIR